jgi:hypothetical protein
MGTMKKVCSLKEEHDDEEECDDDHCCSHLLHTREERGELDCRGK